MPVRRYAQPYQPPLKWAGGKRWLVPHLKPIWRSQQNRRLVEPFCGGLAVTLGLMPNRALVNDINPHLINFFRQVQQGLKIAIPTENDKELYYTHRARFNELVRQGEAESSEAAQLFYYLNRTGYNGLCRFNRSGEFNVPFGKYKAINYVTDFLAYCKPLSQWEFRVGSFESLALDPGDFVYADPPYDVEFVSYSKEGFSWDDQVRLAEWLVKHPGPVVLSNQATERIVKLYQDHGFTLQFLKSPRRINSTGDRTPALEVLALKGMAIPSTPIEVAEHDGYQLHLL
jgi:DNA adenine methylase